MIKKAVFIGLILIIIVLSVLNYINIKEAVRTAEIALNYEKEILLKDQLIFQYEEAFQKADTIYLNQILKVDSIKKLRYEKDSIIYHYSADSIQRIWAKRFGEN